MRKVHEKNSTRENREIETKKITKPRQMINDKIINGTNTQRDEGTKMETHNRAQQSKEPRNGKQ